MADDTASKQSIERLKQQFEQSRQREAEREKQKQDVNKAYAEFKEKQAEKQHASKQSIERLKQQVQESRDRRQQGVTVRAGPTKTRQEGGIIIEETPQITLPASEVQRRGFAALKAESAERQATGGGRITASDIEARRTAAIAREVKRTGGVTIRTRNQAAIEAYQRQRAAELSRPTAYEYVDPRMNIRFGSQRIGDIITREARRGEKSTLYPPRTVYDNQEVKRFMRDYGKDVEYVAPDPTNPFNIQKTVKTQQQKQAEINPFLPEDTSPGAGAIGYFEGFGKMFYAGFSELFDPKTRLRPPKIPPSLESAAISAGISRAFEFGTTRQTAQSDKELRQLQEALEQEPGYFAESAAASAALYVTPFGISKLLSRFGAGVAKAAPRARFDYETAYGSFADRPSVRFGPYNPTRWENPEVLAELNKFRMSIDIPKTVKVTPPAAARSFEAFESVRGKQERTVRTRSGSLLIKELEQAMDAPVMADTKQFAVVVEPTRAATTTRTTQKSTTSLLGGGANIFTSTQSLGFKGETGATRKRRRREDDIFSYDYLIGGTKLPKFESGLDRFAKQWNPGLVTFGQRDALDKAPQFRGFNMTRDARVQKDLLSEYTKLAESQMPRLDTMTGQSTATTTRQQQRTAQVQAQTMQQILNQMFGQATMQGRIQSTRQKTVMARPGLGVFTFPVFGLPTARPRRGRKGKKRSRIDERRRPVRDVLELAYGEDFAKAFNKAFGLQPDPYGRF